jgi:hypothetical protein
MKTTYLKHAFVLMMLIVGFFGLLATGAHAAASSTNPLTYVPNSYTPLAPLPDVTSDNLSFATSVNFATYVKYLFNLLIALGAVAAVFMITWGGFEYMTSDAVNGKKDGITKVTNAIYGLLMILSSWLILRTIDPRFVNISPTLVEPLHVKVDNPFNAWMGRLSAEVAAFNVDQADARQKLADAAIQLQSLAQAGTDLEDKIANIISPDDSQDVTLDDIATACYQNASSDSPDENLGSLCAQYLKNQDDQNQLQSATTLFQAQKIMDTILNKCGSTGATGNSSLTTPLSSQGNCYSDHQSEFNTAYSQFKDQLTPQDQAALLQYKNFSEAQFEFDKLISGLDNYQKFGGSYVVPMSDTMIQAIKDSGKPLDCQLNGVLVNKTSFSNQCVQEYITAVQNYYLPKIQDQTMITKLKVTAAKASSFTQ